MSNLRYSDASSNSIAGWLNKEGHRLHTKTKRYFKLTGSILSNHTDEDSEPSWQVDIWNGKLKMEEKSFQFILQLIGRTLVLYANDKEDYEHWGIALKRACCTKIREFYSIREEIGKGTYGVVMEAYDRVTGEKRAVKMIKKTGHRRENEYLQREVNIMRSVNHPNVIRTYDIFDSENKLYLVMEYVPQGELFHIISERKTLTEHEAAMITSEILQGVSYLHDQNIVHRDIKPENILCANKDIPLNVKLTDFGLSNIYEENDVFISYVGTKFYQAPELFNKQIYGKPVDLFAVGVVLFVMLSLKFPFVGQDEEEHRKRLIEGVVFPPAQWETKSALVKNLLRAMLDVDPERRPTAREALQHPWFQTKVEGAENDERDISVDVSNLESIASLKLD